MEAIYQMEMAITTGLIMEIIPPATTVCPLALLTIDHIVALKTIPLLCVRTLVVLIFRLAKYWATTLM